MIFSSCVTAPRGGVAPEEIVVSEFESIETIIPRWQTFAASGSAGVLAPESDFALFAGKTKKPRLEFWALRVDLSSANARVTASGGGGERNPNGSFPAVKVSSFVRGNGLLAGINALPFDKVSGREGEERFNAGVVISGGLVLSPPHTSFDALVFYPDGKASVVSQAAIREDAGIEHAVGGFWRILEDGSLGDHADAGARHPRSAAGVSADGKTLYLLVIDGRRPGSAGATLEETAVLLRALGAQSGINFDGGGSSALALRFADGVVRVVNTPVHGIIPGRERAVAGCLGIGLR